MPSTSISFTVPPGLEGSFRIFSVNGAVVKSCQALKGKSSIRWDGKDASGRALASGLYVGKLELSNGKSLRHNLLLLR
jgi:flagellar hook assembly protein FlgD